MTTRIATAAVIGLAAIGGCSSALRAQTTRSVWDGVYTEAQAKRGAALFDQECASCHGPAGGGGGTAPALVGSAFAANYDGQTVGDLVERTRQTMPVGKEGQLSRQQNADITAFILQLNEFPAGTAELPRQAQVLNQIKYVATKPPVGSGFAGGPRRRAGRRARLDSAAGGAETRAPLATTRAEREGS